MCSGRLSNEADDTLFIKQYFKCLDVAYLLNVYRDCEGCLGGVYSVQCSTLALVQAGKCQLAGLTESVHNTVINIQMSTS